MQSEDLCFQAEGISFMSRAVWRRYRSSLPAGEKQCHQHHLLPKGLCLRTGEKRRPKRYEVHQKGEKDKQHKEREIIFHGR